MPLSHIPENHKLLLFVGVIILMMLVGAWIVYTFDPWMTP